MLGVLVWMPRLFHRAGLGVDKTKTAKGKRDAFNETLGQAIKLSQEPEAQARMATWAAVQLKVTPEQLKQECQQYKLSLPELYYVYCLRPRGETMSPMEDVLALKETEKDWYQVGIRRGNYPNDIRGGLVLMIGAGERK